MLSAALLSYVAIAIATLSWELVLWGQNVVLDKYRTDDDAACAFFVGLGCSIIWPIIGLTRLGGYLGRRKLRLVKAESERAKELEEATRMAQEVR